MELKHCSHLHQVNAQNVAFEKDEVVKTGTIIERSHGGIDYYTLTYEDPLDDEEIY